MKKSNLKEIIFSPKDYSIKHKTNKFLFKSKLWKFDGAGGWHFMTIPKSISQQIRTSQKLSEEGWGRLKTSVRKKEGLDLNNPVEFQITFKENRSKYIKI